MKLFERQSRLYSTLNASSGLTPVARLTGTTQAAMAAMAITRGATVNGSQFSSPGTGSLFNRAP